MKGINIFLAACFVAPTLSGALADTVKGSPRATVSRNQQNNTTTNTRNTGTTRSRTTPTKKTENTKNVSGRVAKTKSTVTAVKPRTNKTSVSARTTKTPVVSARTPETTQSKKTTNAPRTTTLARSATTKTRESVMNRNFSKCKTVFFECMDEFCANKDAQLKRCACSSRTNEFKSTQKSLDAVEDKLLDFSQRLLKVNMDPNDAAVINQESEGEAAYNSTKDKTKSQKTLNEIAKKLNTSFDSAENGESGLALTWSLDIDSAFDDIDSISGIATSTKSGTALRNAALPICREMAAEVCDEEDQTLVENSYNMAIEQDCNTVKRAYETQTQKARTKVLENSALLDMTRLNTYQDNNSDDVLTCKTKMLDMLSDTTVCGKELSKCLDVSGRYINPTTGEVFLSPELVNISELIARPTGTDTWAKAPRNSTFVSYLNSKKKYLDSATKNCQTIADDIWDDFIEDALAKIKLAQDAKLEEVRQSCTTLMSECITKSNETLENFDSRALTTFGVMADKTANALCENVKTSCTAVLAYNPDTTATPSTTNDWAEGVSDIMTRTTYNKIIETCSEVGRGCIINACKSITGNFGMCESLTDSVNRHSILTRRACWTEVYNCVAQAGDTVIDKIHLILPIYGSGGPQDLYEQMYGNSLDKYQTALEQTAEYANLQSPTDREAAIANARKVGDICLDNGACSTANNVACYTCRIAEQIWGHCKDKPGSNPDNENAILIPTDPNTSTLLSWFANNTHTQDESNSCGISMCPFGTTQFTFGQDTMCVASSDVLQCNNATPILCRNNELLRITLNNGTNTQVQNCCPSGKDKWGNCCATRSSQITTTNNLATFIGNGSIDENTKICAKTAAPVLLHAANVNNNEEYIFCDGYINTNNAPSNYSGPSSTVTCNGSYIKIMCYPVGTSHRCYYDSPEATNNNYGWTQHYDVNYYINANPRNNDNTINQSYCDAEVGTTGNNNNTTYSTDRCTAQYDTNNNSFTWGPSSSSQCGTPNKWLIDIK